MVCTDRLGKTTDQGDGDYNPVGLGDEIVHGQPGHLHQIAHGAFAAIVLPVGVGDKADRGIERQIGRDPGKSLRV
jgi:hypothetical protein